MNAEIIFIQTDQTVGVKLIGKIGFDLSQTLYMGIRKLKAYDEEYDIVLDVSECQHMDSTILGLLLDYVIKSKHPMKCYWMQADVKKSLELVKFETFVEFEKGSFNARHLSTLEAIKDEKGYETLVKKAHRILAQHTDDKSYHDVIKSFRR